MRKINFLIVIAAIVAICSCSAQNGQDLQPERNTAVVTSIIDGWNAYAFTYHFAPAYTEYTLGQLYKGSDFRTDMDGMEEALAIYYGIPRGTIHGDETMGFAHFDDETIDVE